MSRLISRLLSPNGSCQSAFSLEKPLENWVGRLFEVVTGEKAFEKIILVAVLSTEIVGAVPGQQDSYFHRRRLLLHYSRVGALFRLKCRTHRASRTTRRVAIVEVKSSGPKKTLMPITS